MKMRNAVLLASVSPVITDAHAAQAGDGATLLGFLLIALAILLYLLPAIIAHRREHPNRRSITVVNVGLGWTLVGWIVALAWAVTGKTEVRAEIVPQANVPSARAWSGTDEWAPRPSPQPAEPMKKCRFCAEDVKAAAIKCKHCGSDLTTSAG